MLHTNQSHRVGFYSGFLVAMFIFILSLQAQEAQKSGMIQDFLNVFSYTAGKVDQLAGEIPEDKYDWRPDEGIRSVKEVVLHAAGANYFFVSMVGTPVPEGIDPRNLEKTVESKAEAIKILNSSVKHVQDALKNVSEETLDKKVDFFGRNITKRQAIFILGDHIAEHMGQLIAYARTNKITPPWSKKEN